MFGMGFTEILIIAIIAILFLGPDKLPSAMVDIAKFLRNAKNAIGSVKDSFEHEMEATGIKEEALAYKKELLNAQDKLSKVTDIKGSVNAEVASIKDGILDTDKSEKKAKKAAKEDQEVTFTKKTKKIEPDTKETTDV